MPAEPSSDVKFEIGHVLFIDIVGYLKLLITEQSARLQTLKEIVRSTEQFRLAEAAAKVAPIAHRRRCGARLSHEPGSASPLRAGDQRRTYRNSSQFLTKVR